MEEKKIISISMTKCEAIEFNSVNDLIHVKITEDNGPILILEDSSMIIFSDICTYFDLTTAGAISNGALNISILDLQYPHIHEDTPEIYYNSREIIEVTKYDCGNNLFIYRLFVGC